MKLNNKGFAITAVLYGLLILFVILVSSYLLVLSAKKDRVNSLTDDIEKDYRGELEEVIETQSLSQYITDLFVNNNPTEIIHYKEDKTTIAAKYYYSYINEGKTWGLMNDGLGATINDTNLLINGTQGNIRYYGDNPNNYIYFNCKEYRKQTTSTCELWRIIGVFDGKIKIIRNINIGNNIWDDTSNNWSDSNLKSELNDVYYNTFSDKTKKLIDGDSTWFLEGYNNSKIYSHESYGAERGEMECDNLGNCDTCLDCNNKTTWSGNIALLYPSDYGYASDLQKCIKTLYNYDTITCSSTNWIQIMNPSYQWFITPLTEEYSTMVHIKDQGNIYPKKVNDSKPVSPVLYLNENLEFNHAKSKDKDGNTIEIGTKENPFQIYIAE